MMSKEEREHLVKIKAYIQQIRDADSASGGVIARIQKLFPELVEKRDLLMQNIDWLIAMVEREGNLKASDLLRAVERYEKNKQGK